MKIKVYDIQKVNDVVAIRFTAGEYVGEFKKDISKDGIDINRVAKSLDEYDEQSYLVKKSAPAKLMTTIHPYTKRQVISKLERLLK